MENSIYKVHEMINKVGFEFDDADAKRVTLLAEKAGKLAADNMTQALSSVVAEIGDIFNQALVKMGKEQIDLTDMIKMPTSSTIDRLTGDFVSRISSNISDGIIDGINDGVHRSKSLLKDLSDLKNAYMRHHNKSGERTGKKIKSGLVNSVKSAFEYEPSDTAIKIGNNLRAITNEFNKAVDWEDQYAALLKYIKAYEALEKISHDPATLEKYQTIGDYTIQDLKQHRTEIEHSLQNIFNVAYNKACAGLTDAGDIEIGVKLTPIKMIDVYDVVGKKGHIEVEVVPVIKRAKKNVVPNMYRGVHRPNVDPSEGTIEGKRINREILGGNYWVNPDSQDFVARAYGEESGLDDARTIKAYANPLNKLHVDATKDGEALLFSDIDQIDLLRYLFPGIEKFKNVADVEGYDLTQKFYNEMARQSGFDLLEIFGVNEGGDEVANTIVTLQNRIIEYIGNIPSYLDIEKFTPEIERDIISRQKGSAEQWYNDTINRLETQYSEAEDVSKTGAYRDKKYISRGDDVNKIIMDLPNIIEQLKVMRDSAMQAFDEAIQVYGGYNDEAVKQGLPKVIAENEDGQLIGRITEESLKERLLRYADLISVAEDDESYDQAQTEIDDLYGQILSAIPEKLQGDADNLLTDFAYGDKSIDEAMEYFAPHVAYKENLLSPQTPSVIDDAEQIASAEHQAADAAERRADAAERDADAQARREELVNRLKEYEGDVLTSQEADTNLQERERILQQLRDEDLLTEEIEGNYNEINQRLQVRADLLRQAEGYYDDVNDVLTGARVNSIDDETQYRRDHIKPFDDTIAQMQSSGFFSENEIEQFLAISDAMEERIGTVVAEASIEKLDALYDETDNIADADRLNNILEERKQILDSIENVNAGYLDYSDEIEHQKAINAELEKRVALLREAQAGRIDIDDIDSILQENGTLESKLERLYDVSQDWGAKIKDGEEDEAIDELEAFEETYDRIVLKLANGRNIEILPNAKGLRALYKYSDGIDSSAYGETEIDDVIFERVAREAVVAEQSVDDLNESIEKTHQLNQDTSGGVGTGDASSADLKALQDEAENLRQENERLQDEVLHNQGAEEAYRTEQSVTERLQAENEELQRENEILRDENVSLQDERRQAEGWYAEEVAEKIAAEQRAEDAEMEVEKLRQPAPKKTDVSGQVDTINTLLDLYKELGYQQDRLYEAQNNRDDLERYSAQERIEELRRLIAMGERAIEVTDLLKEQFRIALESSRGGNSNSKSKKTIDNAIIQYQGEADGANVDPQLTEKIKTAITELLKYSTTLQEADQFSGQLENGIKNLAQELRGVSDKEGLATWREHFKQFKNMSLAVQMLVKDYQELGILQAKMEAETDPTKLAHYLDNLEILQDSIAAKAVNVDLGDDRFEEARQRAYNITQHELQQKEEVVNANQVEAEIVKRLIKLYEQLGKARAAGNMMDVTRIRRQISNERSQLTSVDYATDMKFKSAKDKGYNAERTKAENAELKEQESIVKQLIKLYQEYGNLHERMENAEEGMAAWYGEEAKKIENQILAETQKIKIVTDAMHDSFDAAYSTGRDTAASAILKKLYGEEDKAKGKAQSEAGKTRIADLNNLIKKYEQLGRAQAEFAQTGSLETEHEISSLKQIIASEKKRLNLTGEQIAILETKRNIAKEEKQEALEAEQREKTRLHYANEESKAQKKKLQQDKKFAQKEAMTSRAGAVIRKAEAAWMSGIGIGVGSKAAIPPEFNAQLDEYYHKLGKLRKAQADIQNSDGVISDDQKKELIDQAVQVDRLTTEIGELIVEYQRLSGDNTSVVGPNMLGDTASMEAYKKQLTDAVMAATHGKAQIKSFDAETKTLTYTVKTGKNQFTEYTAAVRRLDQQLVSTQGTTKKSETFFEATTRKMKELTSYISGMSILSRLAQEFRRGIQYVREIDLALTELKKVTDATEEGYDKFLKTAAKTGAKLGTPIAEVTRATATFAKLGYEIGQATEMAEAAIVYKNVGDNISSTEDAADSIISTLKGFKMESSQTMAIVDKFNEVGNKFAITSQGIGEALRLSASALNEGKNSLDESIALITAANEVVRFMPRTIVIWLLEVT